jgi:hypothetical protein
MIVVNSIRVSNRQGMDDCRDKQESDLFFTLQRNTEFVSFKF